MNDVQRVNKWMAARGLTKKQMAREMGLSYITFYHGLVKRGKKFGTVPGSFVVKFIAAYGIDEAREVFAELSTPEPA